jgi:hypothetical protein
MGDRGNIVMKYEGGQEIWFYAHWSGSDMAAILASALERGRGRWNDDSYLSRIIFCELIEDDVNGTTGFGISPHMCDNEHVILVVDCQAQKVSLRGEKSGPLPAVWTFEQFAKLSTEEAELIGRLSREGDKR